MTEAERRLQRIRHAGRLFGWKIGLRDGDEIVAHHESGRAIVVWPAPCTEAEEQTLLTLLRLPLPLTEAQRVELRHRQRRRAEALAGKASDELPTPGAFVFKSAVR